MTRPATQCETGRSAEFENIRPPLKKYVAAEDCKNEGWSSLKDGRERGMVECRANHYDPDTHGSQRAQGRHQQSNRANHFTYANEISKPDRQAELWETTVHVRHSEQLRYSPCPDVESNKSSRYRDSMILGLFH
jgi:hypothetical protein